MKKVLCLVMLVTLVGWAAAGNGFMTDGGSWDVATNWSAGVVPQDSTTDPGTASPAWNNDVEIWGGNTAVIGAGTDATAYGLMMGQYGNTSGVTMTGGSLEVGTWGMNIGRGDVQTGVGTFQMSGGVLNADYVNLPQQWGTNSGIGGLWTMDGGVANVGWLRLGGDTGSGTGTLELNDGVINLSSHLDIGGTASLMDIEAGIMNIHHVDNLGSLQAALDAIDGWITAGYITAYAGDVNYSVGVSYIDENIVVQAVPEPATLSLLAIGGLLLRRKKN